MYMLLLGHSIKRYLLNMYASLLYIYWHWGMIFVLEGSMFLITYVTLQMSCQCTKMQYAQNNSTLIKLEFQAVMEWRCAQLSNIAFVYILGSAISMLLIHINIFWLKEIYHNPETKKNFRSSMEMQLSRFLIEKWMVLNTLSSRNSISKST